MSEPVYFHTGDLGDVISSLPAVIQKGAGYYRLGFKNGGQRESMLGARFDSIKPLLEAQPYIRSCEWTWNSDYTLDFSRFRESYRIHDNLAIQHARYAGVEIDLAQPWLSVEPINHGLTVIARSSRYHNPMFPWRKVLEAYPEKIFVGLQTEHKAFQESFGEIPYYETKDLLELARVIAGATQLVTNQTCAFWIGAGLGVPIVQETYLADQNSTIERPNCVYTRSIAEVNRLLYELAETNLVQRAYSSRHCAAVK